MNSGPATNVVEGSTNSLVPSPDLHPATEESATCPASSSEPVLGPRRRKPPVRWADESTAGIYAGLSLDPDTMVEPKTYE